MGLRSPNLHEQFTTVVFWSCNRWKIISRFSIFAKLFHQPQSKTMKNSTQKSRKIVSTFAFFNCWFTCESLEFDFYDVLGENLNEFDYKFYWTDYKFDWNDKKFYKNFNNFIKTSHRNWRKVNLSLSMLTKTQNADELSTLHLSFKTIKIIRAT